MEGPFKKNTTGAIVVKINPLPSPDANIQLDNQSGAAPSTTAGPGFPEDEMPDEDWEGEQDSLCHVLATTDLDGLGLVQAATRERPDPGEPMPPGGSVLPGEPTPPGGSVLPGGVPPAERSRVGDEVVKARMKARVGQAQRIKKKREAGGVRPVPGGWFRQRRTGRGAVTLSQTVGGWTPRTYSKQQVRRL